MKSILTKFKGWITNLSLTTILAGVITAKNDIIPAFTSAMNMEVNVLAVAGAIGTIIGVARKFTKTYKDSK